MNTRPGAATRVVRGSLIALIGALVLNFTAPADGWAQSRKRPANRHGIIRSTAAVQSVVDFIDRKAGVSFRWKPYLARLKRGQRALKRSRRESQWARFRHRNLVLRIVKRSQARRQMAVSQRRNPRAVWYRDQRWTKKKSRSALWMVELPNLRSGGLIAYLDGKTGKVIWVEILVEG